MNSTRDPQEFTRSLLNTPAVVRHGFLDVLRVSTSSPASTFAQRAMNSKFVAAVYEHLWRPVSFYAASGVTTRAEMRRAAASLRLSEAKTLLDVACGPGNFTGSLAQHLDRNGHAIGLDISESMLTRAVLDNSQPQSCYVRGDATRLPFADETFDAVCCFGALYLMPQPFDVAHEMIRVLKPGGRLAILTSYIGDTRLTRRTRKTLASPIGLHLFDRTTFTDLLSSAGLTDFDQQIQRALQFITATKPIY